MGKRLTIYDIKRLTSETEPYFFSPKTMKFFGQRLSDYQVYKLDDEHYKIKAPMIDKRVLDDGRTISVIMGYTERIFNTKTRKLENVSESKRKMKRLV